MSKAPLDNNVLVINKSWMATHLCDGYEAFKQLYEENAEVIWPVYEPDGESPYYEAHTFKGWLDRGVRDGEVAIGLTQGRRIALPTIIRLYDYNTVHNRKVRYDRRAVMTRDQFTCQYCGQRYPLHRLNIDHVVPRAQGGRTGWENVVCSCIPCNSEKADRTPRQAGMTLLSQPKMPHWLTQVALSHGMIHRDWKPFLFQA